MKTSEAIKVVLEMAKKSKIDPEKWVGAEIYEICIAKRKEQDLAIEIVEDLLGENTSPSGRIKP